MSRIYKLPCGCIVESGTERIVEQCARCSSEFIERHDRAVADRRAQVDAVAA